MNLDELALTIYGNPVLRRRAKEVTTFDSELEALSKRMFEIMYEEEGVGLAAPQAGVSLRLTVMDVPFDDGGSYVGVLVNPEILEHRGEQKGPEGCLSIPGIAAEVEGRDRQRDEHGKEAEPPRQARRGAGRLVREGRPRRQGEPPPGATPMRASTPLKRSSMVVRTIRMAANRITCP